MYINGVYVAKNVHAGKWYFLTLFERIGWLNECERNLGFCQTHQGFGEFNHLTR